MKRFPVPIIVAFLFLFASCDTERGADVLRSMEAAFERDLVEIDSEMSRRVEDALYKEPKFGRERMEPDYRRAKSILAIKYAFDGRVDSLKEDMKKSNGNNAGASFDLVTQKLGGKEVRKYFGHLIGSVVLEMFDAANLDSVEQMPLYRDIKERYPYTFSDSMWRGDRHFSGSFSLACMEFSLLKLEMARATSMVVNRFIDHANRGCVLRFEDQMAFATTRNSVVLPDDEVQASVFFGLRSDTEEYKVVKVEMGGKELDIVNNYAEYKGRPKGRGLQQLFGRVHFMKKSDGYLRSRPVKAEYLVLDPVTAVTTQTPRFLLTRTENRIEVSVLGVYKSAIVVRSDKGFLAGKDGDYTLRVDDPGPVKLEIWAKRFQGELRKMDSVSFMAVDELPK